MKKADKMLETEGHLLGFYFYKCNLKGRSSKM